MLHLSNEFLGCRLQVEKVFDDNWEDTKGVICGWRTVDGCPAFILFDPNTGLLNSSYYATSKSVRIHPDDRAKIINTLKNSLLSIEKISRFDLMEI